MTIRRLPVIARRRGLVCMFVALVATACTSVTSVPTASPAVAPTPGSSGSVASASTADAGSVQSAAISARTLPVGATADVDEATWALADRLSMATYTSDTTDAMTAALARAGVATFADPSSQAPEVAVSGTQSPLALLDFQTHALAVGAWADTTWSGAELDQVLPVPDGMSGVAPTSDVLAGYVAAVDTPGAQLARALMAGQNLLDPATVEFPGVVLVLFASDTASASASGARPTLSPGPAAQVDSRLLALAQTGPGAVSLSVADAPAGPCSTAAAWIQGTIDRLFNALKIQAQNNIVLAVVAAIWNWIVDKLQKFVENIITTVTSLIFGYVKVIAGEIATVAENIASVLPFAVAVSVTGPTSDQFDLTTSSGPMPGAYIVSVTAGDLPDWPDILKDCAKVAGIQLPDFHAKNVPLTWGPLEVVAPGDPLLGPVPAGSTDAVTDATGSATWNFQTSTDPGDKDGPIEHQVDIMHVAVHRPELDQIRAALTRALLGFIPPILQDTVLYLIGKLYPAIAGIQSSVNALLDRTGEGAAWFTYHGKVPPTPAPTQATPGPSAICTTTLPAGTYNGTMTTDSVTSVPPGEIDLGEAGTTTDDGTGPVTITVAADGTLSGTFSQSVTETAQYTGLAQGTRIVTQQQVGAGISGTLCTMTMSWASETETSCQTSGPPIPACDDPGTPISLVGLVPPLPMPAPTRSGSSLTWVIQNSSDYSAGFGGLGGHVTESVSVTINVP